MIDLRTYRYIKNLSQEKLAKLTGVHHTRLCLVETGTDPTPKEKAKIEEGLRTSIDWPATKAGRKVISSVTDSPPYIEELDDMKHNKVTRIFDGKGNIEAANYYMGDRLIRSETHEKGFIKVNHYNKSGLVVNSENYKKVKKKGVVPNTRQPDGTGVPLPPEPRYSNEQGKPDFFHL